MHNINNRIKSNFGIDYFTQPNNIRNQVSNIETNDKLLILAKMAVE